jgi:molecular chaperone DnaK
MYTLGVDLGTTFTAAAVRRGGRSEVVQLGTRSAVVPSVVLQREDGTLLVGEAAARRAITEPQRFAREFKRRFGDPTPILLGGTPWSPQALTARLLSAVVTQVAEREGEQPAAICVCHPASWRDFTKDLLHQAVRLADLAGGAPIDIGFVTEPEAAAAFYADKITGDGRVKPGAVIAVYDLGGGTFDSAVLRRTVTGFEILGQPEGIEHLGGVDIDAAVFAHVAKSLNGGLEALDEDDDEATAAVARLRQECTQAKEALSADTDVTIPVLLPGLASEVRLTRSELEDAIRPALLDSVAALRRALRSAGVDAEDLHSVLLVGGSSRIPMVAQLVGQELGRPVAVDADPKHAIALGAAWLAGRVQATEVIPTVREPIAGPAPAAPARRAVPAPAADLRTRPEPVAKLPAAGPPAAPKPLAPKPVAPVAPAAAAGAAAAAAASPAVAAASPAVAAATPVAPAAPVVRRPPATRPRPAAVPRPVAAREAATEVMRPQPAPTQLMPAWRPPSNVSSREPLVIPARPYAPPPRRRRGRSAMIVLATLAAIAAGTAGAVAFGEYVDRNNDAANVTPNTAPTDDAQAPGPQTPTALPTTDPPVRETEAEQEPEQTFEPTEEPTPELTEEEPEPDPSESVTTEPDQDGGEPSAAPSENVEQNDTGDIDRTEALTPIP